MDGHALQSQQAVKTHFPDVELPKVDYDSPLKGTLNVKEFFKGKTIFMTGVTGFLGKHVLEKILRSCSDIRKIIIMVRPKRDIPAEDRFMDIVCSSCFNLLRNQMGPKEFLDHARRKLKVVEGDITQESFGLSAESLDLITEEAEIFINNAANTHLVDKLKKSLMNNYFSTVQSMAIAKKCKNLKVFLHLSSISVVFDIKKGVIDEKIRTINPMIEDEWNTFERIMAMPDKEVDKLESELIKPFYITYSFAKTMAEKHIQKNMGDMSCVISRPSLILGAYQEPMRGWTDTVMGTGSVLVEITKGTVR